MIALAALQLSFPGLDNVSKELQAVDVSWSVVQYCVTRTILPTRKRYKNCVTRKAIYEAGEECSEKMGIALMLDY